MNVNANGGRYHQGRRYGMDKKLAVVDAILDLEIEEGATGRANVPYRRIAERAQVSVDFAHKVGREYYSTGTVTSPDERHVQILKKRVPRKLGPLESVVLLSLRVDDDRRSLRDYCRALFLDTGTMVSPETVDRFFKTRFEFRGSLRKPNLVPLDKWKPRNIEAYHKFMETLGGLPDHKKYHFVDEKHLANKDGMNGKVRACPLTGKIRAIPVNGSFRMTYNMMAIISANPRKSCPISYILGKENGTATNFLAFIEHLVVIDWFDHNDVLIMDNAAIHTGGCAAVIPEVLWNAEKDGRPLHVVVVPLPTRAPELNPIELVFHILTRRLRAAKYRPDLVTDDCIPRQVLKIFDDLETETVLKCCIHAGY